MMNNEQNLEQAALVILKSTGLSVLEAALIAKEALAANRGKVKRAKRCLAATDRRAYNE